MLALLSYFFRLLPFSLVRVTARLFATSWYYLFPIRCKVALKNIDRVFKDSLTTAQKKRLLRECLLHTTLLGLEGLRLPDLPKQQQLLTRIDEQFFQEALAAKQGVIVVAAHLGGFELVAAAEALRGTPVNVIFKDMQSRQVAKFWQRLRAQTGLKSIAPRRSKEEICAALTRGEVVVLAVDQHLAKHRSIVCNFFDNLAATTTAPVRFALATGAKIIPVATYREANLEQHKVYFFPEFVLELPYEDRDLNIRHNTERLNRLVESWILRAPGQWLWLHKRWKVQDDPRGWDIPESLQSLLQV